MSLLALCAGGLLAGLAASLHCIGMCGPLLVAFSGAFTTGGGNPALRLLPYHAGRIWTYGLLGLLAGRLGASARAVDLAWQRPVALALGVNATVFSVLKAFLLASLAIPEAGRVAFIQPMRELPGRGDVVFAEAFPNYETIRAPTRAFGAVAVISQGVASWDDRGETRPLQASRVSASFFEVMRVFPTIGAAFAASDEGPSPSRVVVISDALWRASFGADRGVVGTAMTINGETHTIAGVPRPGGSVHGGMSAGEKVATPSVPSVRRNAITAPKEGSGAIDTTSAAVAFGMAAGALQVPPESVV